MRILAVASSHGCAAALIEHGHVLAQATLDAERGLAGAIPPLLARLLDGQPAPDAIAVVVGPGSFTALRAGIAASIGIGLGTGCPVIGVTVAEALRAALPPLPDRELWIALDSRRDHVFLETDRLRSCALEALPSPTGPVAIAGDAAIAVAATLAARGANVQLTEARRPLPAAVAQVAMRRLNGELPELPPVPLYVDPPEARKP